MDIRTVETDNSVWRFDLNRMMYMRLPREESPNDSRVPYTFDWEPYTELIRDGTRLLVIRPVPLGQGRWRYTGDIISDTHK